MSTHTPTSSTERRERCTSLVNKTAPDATDKINRRIREDNRQSKKESSYRRVKKKTKREKIDPRDH